MYELLPIWAFIPVLVVWLRRHRAGVALTLMLGAIAAACALQDDAFNRDREVYRTLIQLAAQGEMFVMEPAFTALARALALIGLSGNLLETIFFWSVAAFSLSVKLRLFSRYGGTLYGCFCLFLGYYFLLHEWTQIRIGAAIGLLYFSWIAGARRDWRKFFLFGGIACLLHFSGIIFLLGPLIFSMGRWTRWLVAILALLLLRVASLTLGSPVDALNSLFSFVGLERLALYAELISEGTFSTISPARLVPHLLLTLVAIALYPRWQHDRLTQLFFQIHTFGSVIFIAFWSIPVAAYRLSDLFLFAGILLCGRLARYFEIMLYRSAVTAYSFIFFAYTIFYSGLLAGA
jgi:hypothetical protein